MSEFLRGTAEYFATMAPVVAQAPASAAPIIKMYAAFASRFDLGKAAEDALEQFVAMGEKAAQTPRPDPEAEAMKAEQERNARLDQMEQEKAMADIALKQQSNELQKAKLDLEEKKLGIEESKAVIDKEMREDEMRTRRQEAEVKKETGSAKVYTGDQQLDGEALSEAMMSAVGTLVQAVTNGNEALAQGQQQIATMIQSNQQDNMRALTAPRRPVYENGKLTGAVVDMGPVQ